MAVLRFGKYTADQGANSNMYFGMLMSHTMSQATFSTTLVKGGPGSGNRATILGSGFSFTNVSGPVRLAGGTVTSLALFEDNRSTMSITGITIGGKAFGNQYMSGPSALEDFVTRGNDSLFGTALGDTLFAGAGKDTLLGGEGADFLFGEKGVDRIEGGAGNDTLYGQDSAESFDGNFMFGGAGDDYLNGDSGNDVLQAGTGHDSLIGGAGDERSFGGAGNDLLIGDNGLDRLDGGDGLDTLVAGDGNDIAFGGNANDFLDGGNNNDRLYGGAGADRVTGSAGNDLLSGGAGNDELVGGTGADRFVFDAALGAGNVDEMPEFEVNIDKIVLDDDVFNAIGAVGALAAGKFVVGPDALDANDRIIYNSVTGELYYDRDGNGAASKVLFALMASGLDLDAGDFTIIG